MEKITYKQASETLGVSYQAIKQAVMRGNLTRCAERDTHTYLIKNQVLMFKGKPRISVNALNAEEFEQWQQYANVAKSVTPQHLLADTARKVEREVPQGSNFTVKEAWEMALRSGRTAVMIS